MKLLISFNVSALFTSFPVQVVLKIINRKFMEHLDEGTEHFLEESCFIPKDKIGTSS